jgi:hypothetical protein
MINQFTPVNPAISLFQRLQARKSPVRVLQPVSRTEERLPFTVRLVRSEADLNKAVHIRHVAYARHLPTFAETLMLPEQNDFEDGVVVLLAESKLDGSPLGSMRIQTNRFNPLCLENSMDLPLWLQGRTLAEASRLGITDDKTGSMVKTVLFKAFYQYCQQEAIDYMVITARSPIDRQYERLLFEDVYPEAGYIPLRHVNNLPHRIMYLNVVTAQERWAAVKHPLIDFMCNTAHPDIDVNEPAVLSERRRPKPSLSAPEAICI